MLVLDTHALVWWTSDPKRLSARAAEALASQDLLMVPTIVFWEVALLVRGGKLALVPSVSEWAAMVCSIPRVRAVELSVEVAIAADSLPMHADPADRFIVASALSLHCALATKDRSIQRSKLVRTIW